MTRVFGPIAAGIGGAALLEAIEKGMQGDVRLFERALPLNVSESLDGFTVQCELPGFKAEDVDVSVCGDSLTIAAKRDDPFEAETTQVIRREFSAEDLTRTIALPTDVDSESVEAQLENGVLTVKLGKSKAHKPHKIEIKTG